jgi:hypothetical protein
MSVATSTAERLRDRLAPQFGALVAVQIAHSIEEYQGRLWEVFGPAHAVSSLVADDPARGFVIVNVTIALLGVGCLVGPVRGRWRSAPTVAWWWTVVETGNGIGHLAVAWWQGGYMPGVATAPLLLLFSGWLLRKLLTPSWHGLL